MEKREYITIFTAKLARELLHRGYQIVDLKPDKRDLSGTTTLYIFKNEGNFESDVYTLTH